MRQLDGTPSNRWNNVIFSYLFFFEKNTEPGISFCPSVCIVTFTKEESVW